VSTVRTRLVVLAVIAALGAGGAVAYAMSIPRLKGTVGPGFTISLKSAAGKKVKSLSHAGKYTFVVADKSSIHNFTVKGPGVSNKTITGTGFVGTKTVTLTLKKGTYTYYCTIHLFKGTFKVL
jgi:hypothetical protein